MAKCPHCNTFLNGINGTATTCTVGTSHYSAVVYSCPICSGVLSCQIDPLAMKNDTVSAVIAEMQKRGLIH